MVDPSTTTRTLDGCFAASYPTRTAKTETDIGRCHIVVGKLSPTRYVMVASRNMSGEQ
jgi:hypothetical protein